MLTELNLLEKNNWNMNVTIQQTKYPFLQPVQQKHAKAERRMSTNFGAK
jgi:hypothetical protein